MESNVSSAAKSSFSMEDFEAALEQHDYEFQKGQVVVGKVFNYESSGAYVDIGAKSLAFLPAEEASLRGISDLASILPLGEEREFLIIREQNGDGQVTLSLRELELKQVWHHLAELRDINQSLSVRVTGSNKGGVTVNVQGIRGFIPRSHLVDRGDLEALKGTTLTATILELNSDIGKLVLSNRLATSSVAISQLEIGQLVTGKVTGIKPFGVFVEFDGTTGLIPIAQVSKSFVQSLAEQFQVGQTVTAMIIAIDEGKGRISLSTRILEAYPGEMLENPAEVMSTAESRQGRAKKALLGEGSS
jgi:small subunit ribosomal protein S1